MSKSKATAALTDYLTLGTHRSLLTMAVKWRQSGGDFGAPLRTLERWSSHYHWQDEAARYDQELAATVRALLLETLARDRQERRAERLADARLIRRIVRECLIDHATNQPRTLSYKRPSQLQEGDLTAHMFEVAVNALAKFGDEERKDLGEPTSLQGIAGW